MIVRTLLLILALFGAIPSLAVAGYTSLYVFGDSLSDNGNAFELSGGVWPPSPPYAQRFSNGPTTAELLAARLGVASVPSSLGGTNFAVGGATTGTRNFSFEVQDPFPLPAALESTGMLVQLNSFVTSGPSFNPDTSLFMVWSGPNDFFLALAQGEDIPTTIGNAVTNIATIVGALAAAGATDILVPNMPNLATTPFGQVQTPEAQAALAALSGGFNTLLAQAIADLRAATLLNLIEFDVAGLLDELVANPAEFGFDNVTEACLDPEDPSAVLGGCAGYLYFDSVHPTTAAHMILADRLFATVASVPEPSSVALSLIALLAAVASSAAIGRRRSAVPVSHRPARASRPAPPSA